MHTTIPCAVALAALGAAHAQFTDLQPGANFPVEDAINTDVGSESVDLGDVDNDGDLDLVIGVGGDFGPKTNRIFVNQGGLQGGTPGVLVDESAVRFAGVPNEATRDLDFGDIDGDGDLDLVEANRGTPAGGSVVRILVNQGGAQGGTVGTFADGSATAWGALVSVPPSEQVFGGNQGPWLAFTCDCDFGDLDDDGDLDLFASSYGPNINGARPSRVFLNDGSGVFDEHFPWAQDTADILSQTIDAELVDLDGDFDLDVFIASRDSQSRVFVNNTHAPLPGSTTLFTDTTLESLILPGALQAGTFVYESEAADLDGDGDFELWVANYDAFTDRLLSTTSAVPGSPPVFVESQTAFAQPDVDENEIDMLDFDGDGDLDVASAVFSGSASLYVNGLAQGSPGLWRAGGIGSNYSFPEIPPVPAPATTLDVEVGDLDGDGDSDLVFAQENSDDVRWFNVLGVPDTHAPTFARVTEPDGLALAGDVVIHAAVRDNDAIFNVSAYDVDLVVSVDGAPEQRIDMTPSGSMVFRGALDLGAGAANLEYRVEALDHAGNLGVSATSIATNDWTDLGGGLAGVDGVPSLVALGTLSPGATGTLASAQAAPSAAALLALSAPTAGAPFKGGVLLAVPFDLAIPLTTSPAGSLALPYAIPGDAPSGVAFHLQLLVADLAAIQGIALSNGLRGDVP